MEPQLPRPLRLRPVALAHPPSPDAPRGAELRDLLEEVDVGVEEKRETRCKVIDAHAPFDTRVYVGHSVSEREGKLLDRGRAGLSNVVAGDGDRVPLRDLFGAVLDGVDDQPHRRSRRKDELLLRDELFEDVVLQRATELRRGYALLFGDGDVHAQQDRSRRVDRHRGRDVAERDAVEQGFHVGQRVDRHPAVPDLPTAGRGVRILAHQRGHVKGHRKARLAVGQQVLVAAVGFLRRCKAGELAHRPQAAAVSAWVNPACVRELAGKLFRPSGAVIRGVQRLERDPRDRRRLDPVVARGAGLEVLLPGLFQIASSNFH